MEPGPEKPAAPEAAPLPNPKRQPNRRLYLQILRQMTPEQRLLKAFELSAMARQAFEEGLRERFPDLPEAEFQQLLRRRLDKCHNRNY
jgi:hypothetical protein